MVFTLTTILTSSLTFGFLFSIIGFLWLAVYTPDMLPHHLGTWSLLFPIGYLVGIPIVGFWTVLKKTQELKVQVQALQEDKTALNTTLLDTQDMANCCFSLSERYVQELQNLTEEVHHLQVLIQAALLPPQVAASQTPPQSRPQQRRSSRRYPPLPLM